MKEFITDRDPQASQRSAGELIAEGVQYRQGVQALTFYFARKIVAMNQGHIGKAAEQMKINPRSGAIQDILRRRPVQMTNAAMRAAEQWASRLAMDGASREQAIAIFRCGLIDAALALYGSQAEAARRLKIQRWVVAEGYQRSRQYRRAS